MLLRLSNQASVARQLISLLFGFSRDDCLFATRKKIEIRVRNVVVYHLCLPSGTIDHEKLHLCDMLQLLVGVC